MDALLIIGGLVLGTLLILSGFKGEASVATNKGEAPKSYLGYANAALRGRDPMKEPGKPLSRLLWKLVCTIFWLPDKIWCHWIERKWVVKIVTVVFWIILAAVLPLMF